MTQRSSRRNPPRPRGPSPSRLSRKLLPSPRPPLRQPLSPSKNNPIAATTTELLSLRPSYVVVAFRPPSSRAPATRHFEWSRPTFFSLSLLRSVGLRREKSLFFSPHTAQFSTFKPPFPPNHKYGRLFSCAPRLTSPLHSTSALRPALPTKAAPPRD